MHDGSHVQRQLAGGVAERGDPAAAAPGRADAHLDPPAVPGRDAGHATDGGRLPGALCAKMERAFGADLSGVRIRVGSEAASLGARAFAHGDDLHFAPGAYDPDSQSGQELIGHELAHVVQQRSGRVQGAQAKAAHAGAAVHSDAALEREADELGARAARGERVAACPVANTCPVPGVIQAKLVTWDQLKDSGTVWQPHKTQPNATNDRTPHRAQGYGAHVGGTAAAPDDWTSQPIQVTAHMLGCTDVTVTRLGPDHGVGPAPDPAKLPHTALLANHAASVATCNNRPAPEPYAAQMIVPAKLGGNGADPRQLIALPPDAAQHLLDIHDRLYKLVHQAQAWITLRSKVDYAPLQSSSYASKLTISFGELDPSGTVIPGAVQHVELQVKSPEEHAVGTKGASPVAPGLNGGNKAQVAATGLKPDAKSAVTWRTRIAWAATTASGDGSEMVADPLGPDHKIGEEPAANPKNGTHVWNQRTRALKTAAGVTGSGDYVAGHLLNHHLGGPGNDPRNLAPIPADGNHEHLVSVEKHVKQIVNEQHGWVYYRVKVHFSTDNGTSPAVEYPSAFECHWHQLDPQGQKLDGTVGQRTITMKAPSTYKTGGSTMTDHKFEHHAGQKVSSAATTQLGYDELVLEEPDTLGSQRDAMKPLVAVLQKMEMAKFFHESPELKADTASVMQHFKPSGDEVGAKLKIAEVTGAIQAITSSPTASNKLEDLRALAARLAGDLKMALDSLGNQLTTRHAGVTAALQNHLLRRYSAVKVGGLVTAFQTALSYDAEACKKLLALAEEMRQLLVRAIDQWIEHREALVVAANKLRGWLGDTAVSSTETGEDLGRDVLASVETGLIRINDIAYPGTPTQTNLVGEELLGGHHTDSHQTSRMLLLHATTLEDGRAQAMPPVPTSFGGVPLLAVCFDELTKNSKPLPAWSGKANVVATMAPVLLAQWPGMRDAVIATLEGLYATKNDEFGAYVRWLQGEIAALAS